MEKIMHLCFMSWCTEGVSALKVSQDTQLVDLETDCLTFETYWVQDKACRGLISRHDFHCWQDVHETDCLILRQTI